MIKLLFKLAVAALIANAGWRLGSAYVTYYRFRDAVEQATQFGPGRSDGEIQAEITELASQYDIPLPADGFSVQRSGDHTVTEGQYSVPIDFAPGMTRPWSFSWRTDVIAAAPAKVDPSEVR